MLNKSSVRDVLVSIVSHGHGAMVAALLRDLALPGNAERIRVVLTLNAPEHESIVQDALPFPVQILRNDQPNGFSTNHNRAFQIGMEQGAASFYCVLNPDLRVPAGTVQALLGNFEAGGKIGLVAPAVFTQDGGGENSVRPLPDVAEIAFKAWDKLRRRMSMRVPIPGEWYWVAGMFMLFDAAAYRAVKGFDERYFLYYEDVDICCRLDLHGYRIRHCPSIGVVHHARRDSHRQLVFFFRHLNSAIRFFLSPIYFRCRRKARTRS